MGGYGSGRWGWGHYRKDIVENCRQLDAWRWVREGIIGPDRKAHGSWVWLDGQTKERRAAISYLVRTGEASGEARLMYNVTPQGGKARLYDYAAGLTAIRPTFGGLTWYFTCPHCGRRTRKLYMPPGGSLFLCRSCHGLTYVSCQAHDKSMDRYKRLSMAQLGALLRGNSFDLKAAAEVLERERKLTALLARPPR